MLLYKAKREPIIQTFICGRVRKMDDPSTRMLRPLDPVSLSGMGGFFSLNLGFGFSGARAKGSMILTKPKEYPHPEASQNPLAAFRPKPLPDWLDDAYLFEYLPHA